MIVGTKDVIEGYGESFSVLLPKETSFCNITDIIPNWNVLTSKTTSEPVTFKVEFQQLQKVAVNFASYFVGTIQIQQECPQRKSYFLVKLLSMDEKKFTRKGSFMFPPVDAKKDEKTLNIADGGEDEMNLSSVSDDSVLFEGD